jgi:capsular polysaccharide biosynthesis protein
MNDRVDLGRVVRGGRRLSLILLLTLLGAGAGYTVAATMEPVYRATGSILVGRPFQAANPNKEYIEASQQIAQAYADIATRQPVLEGVIDDLGSPITWTQLRDRVSVEVPADNPQLILVAVDASSPGAAARILNELLDSVVQLSPAKSKLEDREIQDFVNSRLETLQRDIRERQRRIDKLELALSDAALEDVDDLQAQIDANQELVIQWQTNYSALLNFFGQDASPNDLQVLKDSGHGSGPVRPVVPLYTALVGGAGFFVGLALAYALEFRRTGGLSKKSASAGRTGVTGPREAVPQPQTFAPEGVRDEAPARMGDRRRAGTDYIPRHAAAVSGERRMIHLAATDTDDSRIHVYTTGDGSR